MDPPCRPSGCGAVIAKVPSATDKYFRICVALLHVSKVVSRGAIGVGGRAGGGSAYTAYAFGGPRAGAPGPVTYRCTKALSGGTIQPTVCFTLPIDGKHQDVWVQAFGPSRG